MDFEKFMKSSETFGERTRSPGMFKDLDATELYCPKCKRAVPVRKRLLLVLPEGDKYEYRCVFCAESVGMKTDRREKNMTLIV
ncbi:hypothetical protein [Desulfonema magnum]|uniref:Cytoplasmic protein n=1 Tax=Desulfonema magnum TaxID=45655 RepID=A0A975BQD2_9BACT|nr:hypothetical protein [Desulfonema magnum]QTA89929.1 Uncharacterized protein dnm_059880 [Desulfonema magnum]